MKVDVVTKGNVYMHFFIVALMAMAGVPQILLYTSLLWGACGYMSIPLCEEQFDLVLPTIWEYRNLTGLGVSFILLLDNLQTIV